MDYAGADAGLLSLPPSNARAYFQGLVAVNRYNDLGDTAALYRSRKIWEALIESLDQKNPSPHEVLYSALTNFQLSYVYGVLGEKLHAARVGRQAAILAGQVSDQVEAQAALALYQYYKAGMFHALAWMPFVTADQKGPLRDLAAAIPQSRYLKEVLQTSLLWLYYDAARYDDGLVLINAFLSRYPANRLYRQVKADFLFRKKVYADAESLQLTLATEYAPLRQGQIGDKCLPIGYLSAVGNLAKIAAAQGDQNRLSKQLAIWEAPVFKPVQPWLAPSLRREVSALSK